MVAAPAPVPGSLLKKKTVFMRYCATASLATGAGGSVDTETFRANSIFDPDWAVGGHQPMGHDQWSTFYNQYYVKSAKITVKLLPDNNAFTATGHVGCTLGILAGTSGGTSAREQPQTVWMPYASTLANQTQKERTLTYTVDVAKWFGLKDLADDSLSSAAFGANPTRNLLWTVWYDDSVSIVGGQIINVDIVIDYEVVLHTPKRISGS